MKITQATCGSAPIVLLYGDPGRGKTTLACKFPKSIAMLLEAGLPRGVAVDAIGDLAGFGAIMDAIRSLYEDARGYKTLVVDTLDALEPALIEHVCVTHGWKNIESPSYGKGYVGFLAEDLKVATDDTLKRSSNFMMASRSSSGRPS